MIVVMDQHEKADVIAWTLLTVWALWLLVLVVRAAL